MSGHGALGGPKEDENAGTMTSQDTLLSTTMSSYLVKKRNHRERVCEMLEDPTRPVKCIILLAAEVLNLYAEAAHMSDAERRQPDSPAELIYSSVLMKWITAPRTDKEIETLVRFPCSCPLPERRTMEHLGAELVLREKDSGNSPMLSALSSITGHVIRDISDPTSAGKAVERSMRLDRISSRTKWPINLQQLLPHGAETTVRSLIRWLRFASDETNCLFLVSLLEGLVCFTGPQTLPYFITSPAFLTFGAMPLTDLFLDRLRHAELMPKGQPRMMQHRQSLMMMLTCTQFMHNVIVVQCNRTQRQVLLEYCAQDLFQMCARVRPALGGLNSSFSREHRGAAGNIQNFLSELQMVVGQDLHAWIVPEKENMPVTGGYASPLWGSMLENISQRARLQKCSSPECTRTILDTWPFRLCGGCKQHFYCSKACQKIAWKHPAAPHRSICVTIRQVWVANHLSDKLNDMEQRSEPAPATFDKATGQRIVNHYIALTQYEIATSPTYRSEQRWEEELEKRTHVIGHLNSHV